MAAVQQIAEPAGTGRQRPGARVRETTHPAPGSRLRQAPARPRRGRRLRGFTQPCAALGLLGLLADPAAALDLRRGQVWSCPAGEVAPALVYTIGAIDWAGDLTAGGDPDRMVVSLAVDAAGAAPDLAFLPVASRSLGCPGQRYVAEGAALPQGFGAAHDAWRAAVRDGTAEWFAGLGGVPAAWAEAVEGRR